jgi:hypothetical protein
MKTHRSSNLIMKLLSIQTLRSKFESIARFLLNDFPAIPILLYYVVTCKFILCFQESPLLPTYRSSGEVRMVGGGGLVASDKRTFSQIDLSSSTAFSQKPVPPRYSYHSITGSIQVQLSLNNRFHIGTAVAFHSARSETGSTKV